MQTMTKPNLYASSYIIPVIGTNGLKPQRECTQIGLYMTTILVQNNPKYSIKNPNYRI